MKIVVCVKQVPDTADISWTENNTLCREGAESVVNPCDYYATEAALKIKDNDNSEITAISMGPKQAEKALKDVVAMGVDKTLLLSDRVFAGSDTAATARVLAAAIKKEIKDFDLIICGQYATDGDTAQTGPALAQNLKISLTTNVTEIERVNEKSIIVRKKTDGGSQRIELNLPALICIAKNETEPRLPKIGGRMKAQDYTVPVTDAEQLEIQAEFTGLKGSPTHVKRAFRPEGRKTVQKLTNRLPKESAEFILNKIEELKK